MTRRRLWVAAGAGAALAAVVAVALIRKLPPPDKVWVRVPVLTAPARASDADTEGDRCDVALAPGGPVLPWEEWRPLVVRRDFLPGGFAWWPLYRHPPRWLEPLEEWFDVHGPWPKYVRSGESSGTHPDDWHAFVRVVATVMHQDLQASCGVGRGFHLLANGALEEDLQGAWSLRDGSLRLRSSESRHYPAQTWTYTRTGGGTSLRGRCDDGSVVQAWVDGDLNW